MTLHSGADPKISTTLSSLVCSLSPCPSRPFTELLSDGEEILGIGDQGCGGILISVAKLVLTTLCAGIHPNRTLPVVLDCGTDNEDLLNDDLYLGLRSKRIRGERYDKFVDSFVQSARKLYPRAYIHFEDFGLDNGESHPLSHATPSVANSESAARRILDLYSPKLPCFNDDVQGTGCVTLAAIISGLHVSQQKLSDMRVVIFGSGSAGCGIADQIRDAIVTEGKISKEDASKQLWYVVVLNSCAETFCTPSSDIAYLGSSISPACSQPKPLLIARRNSSLDPKKSGTASRLICWP